MLCKTCPHRKVSEGGSIPDGFVPNTILTINGEIVDYIGESAIHPCHENAIKACRGHLRDIKDAQNGVPVDIFSQVEYGTGPKRKRLKAIPRESAEFTY